MIPDPPAKSLCRLCQHEYPREQWQLDTKRRHIIIQFDTECCWNCRRAFWRGVMIVMGVWLAAGLIWWGLLALNVVE